MSMLFSAIEDYTRLGYVIHFKLEGNHHYIGMNKTGHKVGIINWQALPDDHHISEENYTNVLKFLYHHLNKEHASKTKNNNT